VCGSSISYTTQENDRHRNLRCSRVIHIKIVPCTFMQPVTLTVPSTIRGSTALLQTTSMHLLQGKSRFHLRHTQKILFGHAWGYSRTKGNLQSGASSLSSLLLEAARGIIPNIQIIVVERSNAKAITKGHLITITTKRNILIFLSALDDHDLYVFCTLSSTGI